MTNPRTNSSLPQQIIKGLVVDGDTDKDVFIFKQVGKVAALRKKIEGSPNLDTKKTFVSHGGMAHTRW